MGWTRYVEGQTRGVIERPGTFVAVVVIFSFIAQERLTDLLDSRSLHVRDYIGVLLFGLGTMWFSYLIVRAIRKLRSEQRSVSAAPIRSLT